MQNERSMIIPSAKLLCSRYLRPRCAAHPQNQGGHCTISSLSARTLNTPSIYHELAPSQRCRPRSHASARLQTCLIGAGHALQVHW